MVSSGRGLSTVTDRVDLELSPPVRRAATAAAIDRAPMTRAVMRRSYHAVTM